MQNHSDGMLNGWGNYARTHISGMNARNAYRRPPMPPKQLWKVTFFNKSEIMFIASTAEEILLKYDDTKSIIFICNLTDIKGLQEATDD